APVPAPRPKSEVIVSPPRRSLPPPPPVPAGSFSTLAATTVTAAHVSPAPPKRPMPSLPSSDTFTTLPARKASESSIVPPKRPLPSPATTLAENLHPVAPPRAPLAVPPRAASTPSLLANRHDTSAPLQPALPIRSMETPPCSVPSAPSRPLPMPRPVSTVQLANPPPRPLSTISTSLSHQTKPSSPPPTPDHIDRPPLAIPKRPVPHLPPGPEVVMEENENEPTTVRPVPISRRVSVSARPTPLVAVPIKVPLRHIPVPVPAAVPEVPEPQQESPPAGQSVAELLKKLDVCRQNGASAPVFPAPSKPPRVPTTRVPSPPTSTSTASNTTTTTITTSTSTRNTTTTTKTAEPTPAPASRPVPRPVPAPPSLPQRPSLPTRPALPQRPSLPQRPDPAVPPRPELPARPALPKRPQHSTVNEHHSSSSSYSSSTTRTSTGPSGEQRIQKSSHHSSNSSSSCSTSTFQAGEDVMDALARSQPVTTADFNGERLDLTQADFSVQDQHALACPREEEESLARLSWYLTSAFPGDQVAQLRCIFKWIAHNIVYDVVGFMTGNLGDNSAEAVLRNKTGVCAGFANIFYELAAPQDLGVSKVFGVARGFGIEVGGDSLGGGHAWNAVTINGECLLIDSTWGAGAITESGTIDPDSEVRFMPHYFLVRPEFLIYSHWPTNSREQYLDPPVHVDLYRALPFRLPHSWTLGILPSGTSATHTIWTDDDYVEVEVRLVKRAWDGFIPKLICSLKWKPTGEQLFAHSRWDREDAESAYMTIRCFCPSAGSGTLEIAGKAGDSVAMHMTTSLSYRVVNNGTGANMQPLFKPYMVKHFGFSILEPASAMVQSGGGKQTIRVKVFNIPRGGTQPRLCVVGGLIPIPDMLKQVGPNLYETQKTLRPGKYTIGHMGVGIEYLAPFEKALE
ncbi:hypothetical protein BGZ95_011488, partial [Linnemannia exigua]